MDNLGHKRKSYEMHTLDREDLSADPIVQFDQWYHDAEKVGIVEPNAMALATADSVGQPSVRIVLLKGFGQDGFAFYTNYKSYKGQQLAINPKAALVFWWDKLERQIRIEGTVEKLSREESEKYFHSRPRGSQLSAFASPQSSVISKLELAEKRKTTEDRFSDSEKVDLPDNWGGYILKPHRIEFWQGRANRYHDRFCYSILDSGKWEINRLAP